jgi:hypothetical protein
MTARCVNEKVENGHLKFDAKYCLAAASPLLRRWRRAERFIQGATKRLAASLQAAKQNYSHANAPMAVVSNLR